MASKAKVLKWVNDNIVLLVGIPLIIGIHYGWSKLQEVPYLVERSEKKDIPIIAAIKAFNEKVAEKINLIKASGTTGEPQEK